MRKRLTILFMFFCCGKLAAQIPAINNAYRIEGSEIALYLDQAWTRPDQEKLLQQSGMTGLSLDTLWKFGSLGQMMNEGWKVSPIGKKGFRIFKSVSDLFGELHWNKNLVVYNDLADKIQQQVRATFGYNSFKRRSIVALANGNTRFTLRGHQEAKDVYLAGTFSNWSTSKTRMSKTDSGWAAVVKLKPGKHVYKFIVGGRWLEDPDNNLQEDDFYGATNSVYYVTNHEFYLKGNLNAREVVVAGSFNEWNRRRVKMQRAANGWKTSVYLKDGTYSYKFLVDGQWRTDPDNSDLRDDGAGNKNSVLTLGDLYYFKLDGYSNAKTVIVSGEFNQWNEHEAVMKRTADGWHLGFAMAPGNYQYKFIVDGNWMLDPKNPRFSTLKGFRNSFTSVKPNHTFVLKGAGTAKDVKIAGNFNSWSGYTMEKSGDDWVFSLYLTPGKCLYKFIVDGQWIIDPANQFWEQNQYGTGNSVVWITP